MKNKFGFILVKPQLGENIGACARSMKNFGFDKLHIVSPKIAFPNHKAKATSVGAFDIINKAKVFNLTEEAISNLHIQYLNRLSDYLFVLARVILKDNNVKEIEWQKD